MMIFSILIIVGGVIDGIETGDLESIALIIVGLILCAISGLLIIYWRPSEYRIITISPSVLRRPMQRSNIDATYFGISPIEV